MLKNLFNKIRTSILFSYKYRFFYSVIITISFAVINAFFGIYYLSLWYGAIAAYFIVLALLRIYIFFSNRYINNLDNGIEREKAKLLIISGCIVIILMITLSVSVIQMVSSEKPIVAGTILAIANAAYAFYKITISIINLVRARRINESINLTIRCVGFVDSLVSMLSLTVTLLTTFDDGVDHKMLIIGIATAVSLLILVTGLIMLVLGIKRIKPIKNEDTCKTE